MSRWTVRHLDLAERPQALERPAGGGSVYAVFWWRDLPLGMRAFDPGELPLDRRGLEQVTVEFGAKIAAARLAELGGPAPAGYDGRPQVAPALSALAGLTRPLQRLDALAALADRPAVDLSVIVCTRDRPEDLARCLAALAAQRSPPKEVIVVDNAPADGRTRAVVERFPGVRHLPEPRPGLSVARNAGVRAANGALIAFTDDDVKVSPSWTSELVRAFERSDAYCVTGLVLPAELDTAPQATFQVEMGGFGDNCIPTLFDRRFVETNLWEGVQVWRIGAGANMAFRREVFERVGLFDEGLGAGASGCSEDSELWRRVLAAGGTCLYEPRAFVFHTHRRDWAALKGQMRAYMKGHVAALMAQRDRVGEPGAVRRVVVQLPKFFLRSAFGVLKNGATDKDRLLASQVAGWFSGLRYLWTGRRRPVPTLAGDAA
ncbi:MAG TPA: glycosyltransferase [Caulobacteraceae bacterium]|nr:glycosyltransferase [Caulobacteraceae bacterium]